MNKKIGQIIKLKKQYLFTGGHKLSSIVFGNKYEVVKAHDTYRCIVEDGKDVWISNKQFKEYFNLVD
jgi:hypothetical protein